MHQWEEGGLWNPRGNMGIRLSGYRWVERGGRRGGRGWRVMGLKGNMGIRLSGYRWVG